MTQENFTIEETSQKCNSTCPLDKIPENLWRALLRQPFRKRHPFIYWLLVIIGILALIMFISSFFGNDESAVTEDSIALVSIQGPIIDATSDLAWIRKVESNPMIRGVLVRVNSPGGGAAASQEIYAALKRIAAQKPVVVSMGATAASGGLMISMAGERIYANPSTVTGSIGVRMDIPQLQGLMEKIGVGQETLVTAPYKDAASYTHPLTPRDRAYLEGVIENMHEQFVEIVATGRKMSREKAAELANGKVYTGQQAKELGLLDELGGQYEAHQWLADKLKIPFNRKLVVKPSDKTKVMELLMKSMTVLEKLADHFAQLENRVSQPEFLYRY